MLSFARDALEKYTRPLCSPQQYGRKLENYAVVEQAYLARDEWCPGFPVHLHVEATADCNLHCPICPRGLGLIERSGHLRFETFAALFEKLSDTLASMAISGWGEPLLNPETTRMIGLATASGVPVFMNTNGTVLADQVEQVLDAGLSVLCISLDGAGSQAAHVYDSEFPFSSVIRGLAALRAAKARRGCRHPVIQGKFVVTEDTVDEMNALDRWAAEHGVEQSKFKRKIRTMPGQVERSCFPSVPKLLQITQHQVQSHENLSFNAVGCSHPWESLFLAATGQIGLCSWDPHQVVTLGQAGDDLQAIWNGEMIRSVRTWHAERGAGVGQPCLSCNRLPGYLVHESA